MTVPRLIIFDCDGTLVDSQSMIAASMKYAFDAERLEWPGREKTLSIVGLSIPEAMRVLAPDCDDAQHRRLGEGYKTAFQHLRLDPAHEEPLYYGARETVLALAARQDVLLGIATGKSQRGVRVLLEREGLQGLFCTIQTADDAPSKPHPAMVHQAIAEAGVEAASAVLIGDTTYDMEMARSAGVGAIGVSWGYHCRDSLEPSGAHVIIDGFHQLDSAIEHCLGSTR